MLVAEPVAFAGLVRAFSGSLKVLLPLMRLSIGCGWLRAEDGADFLELDGCGTESDDVGRRGLLDGF